MPKRKYNCQDRMEREMLRKASRRDLLLEVTSQLISVLIEFQRQFIRHCVTGA